MCLYSVLGLCLLAYKNLSERLDLHIWHYYSGLHLMSFTENSSQGLNTIKQVPNFIKYTGNIIKILKALMPTKLCGYILEVKYNVRFNDCLQRWEGLSGTTLLKYVCRLLLQSFAVIMTLRFWFLYLISRISSSCQHFTVLSILDLIWEPSSLNFGLWAVSPEDIKSLLW